MSRFRTFGLLATLVALAVTLAACGSSSNSDEDPQKVVENATLEGVESGNLDLSLGVKSTGEEGGDIDVSLSGPFQGNDGKQALPELAAAVARDGARAAGRDAVLAAVRAALPDRDTIDCGLHAVAAERCLAEVLREEEMAS